MSIDARSLNLRHQAACALARDAGQIARKRFLDRDSFTVAFKGHQDFITEVDGEVERFLATRLHALFPDDGFLGEEGEGREAKGDAPTWVVDPIDGTANFARGAPHFCISIGCFSGKDIVVGVIYAPMMDELYSAQSGGGAWLNGSRLKASETKALKQSAIEVGWNNRFGAEGYFRLLHGVVEAGASVTRGGSGALGLAWVAAGRRDGYVETHMNSWDCLAAIALIREAGGYVSDFLAGEGLRKGNCILAAAPGVRDALIAAAQIDGLVL